MVMLRGEHSTERGEGNTEQVIMTELPQGGVFFTERPFFFAGSRKKKACGKVEGKGSVIGNITMLSLIHILSLRQAPPEDVEEVLQEEEKVAVRVVVAVVAVVVTEKMCIRDSLRRPGIFPSEDGL